MSNLIIAMALKMNTTMSNMQNTGFKSGPMTEENSPNIRKLRLNE